MTKNEAYKKAADSLISDNMDVPYNILGEDYTDALNSVREALDDYEDLDEATNYGYDHEWADTKSIYARRWGQENPGLLDRYFEEAVDNFGMDILTTDGMTPIPASAMLSRIYEVACYSYHMAAWNEAMWAVQEKAESYDYESEGR